MFLCEYASANMCLCLTSAKYLRAPKLINISPEKRRVFCSPCQTQPQTRLLYNPFPGNKGAIFHHHSPNDTVDPTADEDQNDTREHCPMPIPCPFPASTQITSGNFLDRQHPQSRPPCIPFRRRISMMIKSTDTLLTKKRKKKAAAVHCISDRT